MPDYHASPDYHAPHTKKNLGSNHMWMRFNLGALKRDPLMIVVIALAVAALAYVAVVVVKKLKREGLESKDDDAKCRKDGSIALTCPQNNLYTKGFNCLHYDGSRCCHNNWFGDNSGKNPGYCKAMDMSMITEPWNIPRFWEHANYEGEVLNAKNIFSGAVTGGWKTLDSGWRNRISSIKVPKNYRVEVATGNNGEGNILSLAPGNYPNMQFCSTENNKCYDSNKCTSDNNNCWNDRINSVRVMAA